MTYSVYNIKVDNELSFTPGPTAGYVLGIKADGTTEWIQGGGGGGSGTSGTSGSSGSAGTSGSSGTSGAGSSGTSGNNGSSGTSGLSLPANSTMNFKSANPTNPTNFGEATPGEMAGIGFTFSMASRPEMMVIITGDLGSGATGPLTLSLRYGTGTAPTNGSDGTGTEISKITPHLTALSLDLPFTLQGIVSGLSVGITYWIDICGIVDDTSIDINNLDVSVVELAGAVGATGNSGSSGTSGTSGSGGGFTGITSSGSPNVINNVWAGSQAEYDNLSPTYSTTTLYFIV